MAIRKARQGKRNQGQNQSLVFFFDVNETTEQQNAVGAWLCDYAEHRQSFDEIKPRHTLNEVGDVADGRYDWEIERGRGYSI